MIHELLTKQQIQLGYRRFIESHPEVQAQVMMRSRETANILDKDPTVFIQIETANLLIEKANALSIDSFDYLLQFAIENTEDRDKIRQLCLEKNSQEKGSYKKPVRRIRKKPI